MKPDLKPGITLELTEIVTAGDTYTFRPEKPVTIYRTSELIFFMEKVAYLLLKPYMEENEESVGSTVNIRHLASTPIGQRVRCKAILIGIEGRHCKFQVEVWDETEKIGEGIIE